MIEDIGNPIKKWKRINMRSVAHLLAVEFIHDLYNRHEPSLNSVRFRHTITIWKDGIVNSYAPEHEWDRLGETVGNQYYNLDKILLKNTKALYKRKRKQFCLFMRYIQSVDLSSLLNEELATLLVKFQSIVLGDLYVLNFVQIEHGLNIAIKKVVQDIVKDKTKSEEIFADLIQTDKASASQKEKQALYRIVKKWKFLKKIFLYKENVAKQDVKKHWERYKYLYSAYGENPKEFNLFWLDFQNYFEEKLLSPKNAVFPRLISQKSRKTLKQIGNKKLNILIPLLIRGGLFRDTNKALLGQSVRYRFEILDELARRNIERRDNLDFYLLSEIVDLLIYSKKISQEKIEARKKDGVVLTRFENIEGCSDDVSTLVKSELCGQNNLLTGQCASQGNCSGECRIVLSKNDAQKVKKGDIMVAIGTDFDLIEAMYRSAAVITEEGGILSHASIVCREIGKPCCIGVKNATKILRDGQKVEVNATKGEIILSDQNL